MRITISNHFHNTEATLIVKGIGSKLTPSQCKRAAKKLCGMPDCQCGWSSQQGSGDRYQLYVNNLGELYVHYNSHYPMASSYPK